MPCPPSLEERKSMECYDKIKDAIRSNQQLADVQSLLRTIDQAQGEHLGFGEEILPILAIKPVNIGNEPAIVDGDWSSPEHKISIKAFWSWADNVEKETHRMEEEACRASTALVCIWDQLLAQGVDCSHWECEYLPLNQYHREHREEDRRWLLIKLNRELESIQSDADKRARLLRMKKAILALDIETLIRDREALLKLRRAR